MDKEKIEKVLRAIENCGEGDLPKMLFLSQCSRQGFIEGVLDFPAEERRALVRSLINSQLLPSQLRRDFYNFSSLTYQRKTEALAQVYDILMEKPTEANL